MENFHQCLPRVFITFPALWLISSLKLRLPSLSLQDSFSSVEGFRLKSLEEDAPIFLCLIFSKTTPGSVPASYYQKKKKSEKPPKKKIPYYLRTLNRFI
jgi:hypothetical protein